MQKGSLVTIRYSLFLQDGSEVDTNHDTDPLSYVQGQGEILPALEEALAPLEQGASLRVTLPPERAYGPINPGAFQEVPRESLPEAAHAVGTQLSYRDAAGVTHRLRVHAVHEESIVLDLNHPLAGETVTFAVTILTVLSPGDVT